MSEPTVRVNLKGSFGRRGGPLYGPGEVDLPISLARALGLMGEGAFATDAPPSPVPNGLPADFPQRETLVGAGYLTLAQVQAASDDALLALPGIGPKRLEEIRHHASL